MVTSLASHHRKICHHLTKLPLVILSCKVSYRIEISINLILCFKYLMNGSFSVHQIFDILIQIYPKVLFPTIFFPIIKANQFSHIRRIIVMFYQEIIEVFIDKIT